MMFPVTYMEPNFIIFLLLRKPKGQLLLDFAKMTTTCPHPPQKKMLHFNQFIPYFHYYLHFIFVSFLILLRLLKKKVYVAYKKILVIIAYDCKITVHYSCTFLTVCTVHQALHGWKRLSDGPSDGRRGGESRWPSEIQNKYCA